MTDKIHLIMPMAGAGVRFKDHGMVMPKPLILLNSKPFFYWATQSVIKYVDVRDIIFVVLEKHVKEYEIDRIIHKFYPDAIIIALPELLNGAVLTCLEGIKCIHDNSPVLFNDCDHAFVSRTFNEFVKQGIFNEVDGGLLTFKSKAPNYSYVVFDDNRRIIGTVEKQAVSDTAICGAYYFRSSEIFRDASQSYLSKCSYKEFYMSGLYNELVVSGMKLSLFPVNKHISFGTPEEYESVVAGKEIESLFKLD